LTVDQVCEASKDGEEKADRALRIGPSVHL